MPHRRYNDFESYKKKHNVNNNKRTVRSKLPTILVVKLPFIKLTSYFNTFSHFPPKSSMYKHIASVYTDSFTLQLHQCKLLHFKSIFIFISSNWHMSGRNIKPMGCLVAYNHLLTCCTIIIWYGFSLSQDGLFGFTDFRFRSLFISPLTIQLTLSPIACYSSLSLHPSFSSFYFWSLPWPPQPYQKRNHQALKKGIEDRLTHHGSFVDRNQKIERVLKMVDD